MNKPPRFQVSDEVEYNGNLYKVKRRSRDFSSGRYKYFLDGMPGFAEEKNLISKVKCPNCSATGFERDRGCSACNQRKYFLGNPTNQDSVPRQKKLGVCIQYRVNPDDLIEEANNVDQLEKLTEPKEFDYAQHIRDGGRGEGEWRNATSKKSTRGRR